MKLVIDISEEDYNFVKRQVVDGITNPLKMCIANGTVLPKGHGRLFDERDIVNGNYEIIGNRIYELEPIIEADKESA